MQELFSLLLKDLKTVGVPISARQLVIKNYSSCNYGTYNPNTDKITLYVSREKDRYVPYNYEDILMTAIHECCHYMQWHDPDFVRVRGVMHNPQFYKMYNKYAEKANAMLLMKEIRKDANVSKKTFAHPSVLWQGI